MQNDWIVLGLFAAVFWGIYIVILKFAVSPKYLNTSWPLAMLGLSLGVVLVPVLLDLFIYKTATTSNVLTSMGFWISLIAGIIWSLGTLAVLSALSNPETDASRLVIVFNLNTIIAVLVSMLLFKELPTSERKLEVIIGAILVIMGSFLASRG